MTYKNMKIEINDEQPLDELLRELYRLGYTQVDSCLNSKFIITYEYGSFLTTGCTKSTHTLTTLQQLREME